MRNYDLAQFSDLHKMKAKIETLELIGYSIQKKNAKRTRSAYHNDTEDYYIDYWEVTDLTGQVINPGNFYSDDGDATVNNIINDLHSKYLLNELVKFGKSLNTNKTIGDLEIL